MQEKTKKLVFFIGAVLVAVIFLTSYAAFSNNNTANTSTSTTNAPVTVFATGNTKAIITNYSQVALITPINNTNASRDMVSNIISNFVANGTVQNFVYSGNSFQLFLYNISAYDLQQILFNKLNSTNSISVGSTAYVMLPSTVDLYYSSTSPPVNVSIPAKNYSVYINGLKSIGSSINVSISALVTNYGTIYNNQFRINQSEYSSKPTASNAISNKFPTNTITSTVSASNTPSNAITTTIITSNSVTVASSN